MPAEEALLTRSVLEEPYGPANVFAGVFTWVFTFGMLAGLTVLVTQPGGSDGGRTSPEREGATPPVGAHHELEVRRVSIAFDWSVRSQVQQALAAAASRSDVSTAQGLHASAEAARDRLLGHLSGARHGAFQTFTMEPSEAEQRFGTLADDLRGRYTVETVTNARRVAMDVAARREEGEGLVVVTLLVAVEGALPRLPTTLDAKSLAHALRSLVPSSPEALVALEVVWSPAEENDRMSSAELEVLYPELVPLAGGDPLGRRACAHCRAVYAAELGRCPACGAAT